MEFKVGKLLRLDDLDEALELINFFKDNLVLNKSVSSSDDPTASIQHATTNR